MSNSWRVVCGWLLTVALPINAQFFLVPSNVSVVEDEGRLEFCIQQTITAPVPLSYVLSTIDISATSPDDYELVDMFVTIPANTPVLEPVCNNLTIVLDSELEGDEKFIITTVRYFSSSDPITTTVTIIDVAVVSVPSTVIVTEDVGTVQVCATLSIPPGRTDIGDAVNITLATSPASATAGEDYGMAAMGFTFPMTSMASMDTKRCLNITILTDNQLEGVETFTVTLTALTTGVIGNVLTTVSIADIIVTPSPAMLVDESVGTVQVCATLSLIPPSMSTMTAINMILATNSSTPVPAVAGSDYVEASMPFTFVAASMTGESRCLDVTIEDDFALESNETFSVTLTTQDNVLLEDEETIVTISDNDEVSVIVADTVHVTESDGVVTVCFLLLSGAFELTQRDFTVFLTTIDDLVGAINGSDYTGIEMAPLAFPMGSMNGDQQCLNIIILDDNDALEGDEMFRVTVTDLDDSVVLFNTEAVITITDNEVVSVFSHSPTLNFDEGAGTVQVCAELSIVPGDASTIRPVEIRLETSGIMSQDDYEMASLNLTFPVGSRTATFQCLNVTIIDDTLVEGEETFIGILTLLSTGLDVTIDNDTTTIIIRDNEVARILVPSNAVNESDVMTVVCAMLTITPPENTSLSANITFVLATTNATAVSGQDYIGAMMELVFAPGAVNGDESQCLTVSILDDALVEGDETFTVGVIRLTTKLGAIMSTDAMITIMDNERSAVVSIPLTLSVEEDEGTVEVCATLSPDNGTVIANIITVALVTTAVSATIEDYDTISLNLIFPVNSLLECVTITIIDDIFLEEDEIFMVTLTLLSTELGVITGSYVATVITIMDDENATVFLPADLNVTEDIGNMVVCAMLSLFPLNAVTRVNITISLTASDVTAIAGLDYTVPVTPLTFPSNSDNTTTVCGIDIINDNALEDEETFIVLLSTEDLIPLGNTKTNVTIIDNDNVMVMSLPSDPLFLREDSGSVSVCITLTSAVPTKRAVQIMLASADGTATGGSDYANFSAIAVFPARVSEMCGNVTVFEDGLVEGDEQFTVVLSSTDPDIVLRNTELIIFIEDIDDAIVGLLTPEVVTSERLGSADMCVGILNGTLATVLSFWIEARNPSSVTSDLATADEDYVFSSMYFNFTPIVNLTCFKINITADTIPESREILGVFIFTGNEDEVMLSPAQGIVVIEGSFTSLNIEKPFVTASYEEDKMLVCNISYPSPEELAGSMPIDLGWETQLSGADISEQSSTVVEKSYLRSVLNIVRVNSSYCGVFTCVAMDGRVALPTTDTATVDIAPVITSNPMTLYVPIFTEATFSCEVLAEEGSLLDIRWTGPISLPPPSNTFQIDTSRFLSVLTFNMTGPELEGNYSCTAQYTNCNSSVTSSLARFAILPPPNVTSGALPDLLVGVGENVIFSCTSTNIGNLSIRWLGPKPGLQGEESEGEEGFTSTLALTSVDHSDGGMYVCVAENEAGEDRVSGVLFVEPVVTPVRTTASNGDRVTFMCIAQTSPASTIQWRAQTEEDPRMFRFISNEIERNLTLLVEYLDSGLYLCVVSTLLFGAVNSSITQLIVSPEGSVASFPEGANSSVGGVVNLTCTASGGPGNTFAWTSPSGDMIVTTPTISVGVSSVLDGGAYTCIVVNDAGMGNTTATINVAPELTESPLAANATRLEQAIMLRCAGFGFPIPTIAWYRNGNLVEPGIVTIITTQSMSDLNTSSVLTIVRPEVNEYHCTLSNSVADVMSERVLVLVQGIPEQPLNLAEVGAGSREVSLRWVEPLNNNAPIMMYMITYMEPDFVTGERQRVINISAVEMTTVKGLFPGVDYTFRVVAVNDIGPSQASDPLSVRTLDEAPANSPDNVRAMSLSSTEIMVTWDEVPPIDQNGIITMYEVQYDPQETLSGQLQTLAINVSAPMLHIILRDLEEFINYTVIVRAYTSVGAGPYSTGNTEITSEAAPASPPENVRVMVLSSTEIMVSWDAVPLIHQNGIITLYEVRYHTVEMSIETLAINVSAPIQHIVLRNLKESMDYTVVVRAYTIVGAGPYSTEITREANDRSSLLTIIIGAVASLLFLLILIIVVVVAFICFTKHQHRFMRVVKPYGSDTKSVITDEKPLVPEAKVKQRNKKLKASSNKLKEKHPSELPLPQKALLPSHLLPPLDAKHPQHPTPSEQHPAPPEQPIPANQHLPLLEEHHVTPLSSLQLISLEHDSSKQHPEQFTPPEKHPSPCKTQSLQQHPLSQLPLSQHASSKFPSPDQCAVTGHFSSLDHSPTQSPKQDSPEKVLSHKQHPLKGLPPLQPPSRQHPSLPHQGFQKSLDQQLTPAAQSVKHSPPVQHQMSHDRQPPALQPIKHSPQQFPVLQRVKPSPPVQHQMSRDQQPPALQPVKHSPQALQPVKPVQQQMSRDQQPPALQPVKHSPQALQPVKPVQQQMSRDQQPPALQPVKHSPQQSPAIQPVKPSPPVQRQVSHDQQPPALKPVECPLPVHDQQPPSFVPERHSHPTHHWTYQHPSALQPVKRPFLVHDQQPPSPMSERHSHPAQSWTSIDQQAPALQLVKQSSPNQTHLDNQPSASRQPVKQSPLTSPDYQQPQPVLDFPPLPHQHRPLQRFVSECEVATSTESSSSQTSAVSQDEDDGLVDQATLASLLGIDSTKSL